MRLYPSTFENDVKVVIAQWFGAIPAAVVKKMQKGKLLVVSYILHLKNLAHALYDLVHPAGDNGEQLPAPTPVVSMIVKAACAVIGGSTYLRHLCMFCMLLVLSCFLISCLFFVLFCSSRFAFLSYFVLVFGEKDGVATLSAKLRGEWTELRRSRRGRAPRPARKKVKETDENDDDTLVYIPHMTSFSFHPYVPI